MKLLRVYNPVNHAPRVICDYIAGMTDPFIYQQYEKYCCG
ncbi:MAG: hypothetical protein ABR920_05790 [Terriglobales bacterium]